MKYLLLLLAPLLLSISPRDHGSDKTVKLHVYNYSDCNATIAYTVCSDPKCTSKSEGTFYANADAVGGVEYTSTEDGPYFCSLIAHLPASKSFELYLDDRCGSGYVAVGCDGETVTVKKVSGSSSEVKVEIDG